MALLFSSAMDPADWWTAELARRVDDLEVRVWPDVGDVADIEFALVWQPRAGDLRRYPNLRAIFSLGAGVDHLLGDPSQLPPGVPIARVVDPLLTAGMTEFVLLHVLRYHRCWPEYMAQAVDHVWRPHRQYTTSDRTIGIMGLGVLGRAAADALTGLGFTVVGWSRSPKNLPGLTTFHGDDGLMPFLGRAQILICMLPLTPATAGILKAGTFAALPEGAVLINLARGAHLVEADLIPALDSGRLSAAALDVFRTEPLPPAHPFWAHPAITVTPHVATLSDPRSVADLVVANIRRIRAGEPPANAVDPAVGY